MKRLLANLNVMEKSSSRKEMALDLKVSDTSHAILINIGCD
jgi:hypothetical protein